MKDRKINTNNIIGQGLNINDKQSQEGNPDRPPNFLLDIENRFINNPESATRLYNDWLKGIFSRKQWWV